MQDETNDAAARPYGEELRHIGDRLALLDEAAARELLEDVEDIAEALISELQSRGKPAAPLAEIRRSLGLDG